MATVVGCEANVTIRDHLGGLKGWMFGVCRERRWLRSRKECSVLQVINEWSSFKEAIEQDQFRDCFPYITRRVCVVTVEFRRDGKKPPTKRINTIDYYRKQDRVGMCIDVNTMRMS